MDAFLWVEEAIDRAVVFECEQQTFQPAGGVRLQPRRLRFAFALQRLLACLRSLTERGRCAQKNDGPDLKESIQHDPSLWSSEP